jgi:hypothetical protein
LYNEALPAPRLDLARAPARDAWIVTVRGRVGTNVMVETSQDLVTWLPEVRLSNPDGPVEYTVTTSGPAEQLFFRVRETD